MAPKNKIIPYNKLSATTIAPTLSEFTFFLAKKWKIKNVINIDIIIEKYISEFDKKTKTNLKKSYTSSSYEFLFVFY